MAQTVTDSQISQAPDLTPDHIMQVGMGFFASRTLLSAVEMQLFTLLSDGGLTSTEIGDRLGLANRSREDFLDALIALGFLNRDGDGPAAQYENTPETGLFLAKKSPAYVGGMLEMSSTRLYNLWDSLPEGLRTGHPQNETKDGGESVFDQIYASPEGLEEFLNAMAGIQAGNFGMLAKKIDFSGYSTVADVGGQGKPCDVAGATAPASVLCDVRSIAGPTSRRTVHRNARFE